MVSADGKPEGFVTPLDNIIHWILEQPLKAICIIFLSGMILGILLSWFVIIIKKWNREEYKDSKDEGN